MATNKSNTAAKPTGNTPDKPKLGDTVSNKQKNEIIMLVVILLLVAVALYFMVIKPGTQQEVQQSTPIDTEFNTDSLEQVRSRGIITPDINSNDTGKTNPFSAQ